MTKTFVFFLLIFILMIAGAVVSMATGDDMDMSDNLPTENSNTAEMILDYDALQDFFPSEETDVLEIEPEDFQTEEYSTEYVLEKYQSLFFEDEIQSESELVSIKINQNSDGNSSIQDYIVAGTVTETIELAMDDSMMLMIFIEKDDTFEFLAYPEEGSALIKSKVKLPFTGKDNPNRIRFIAFPKKSYDQLELDKNLQITDMEIIITTPFERLKEKLLNTEDSLKYLENGQ